MKNHEMLDEVIATRLEALKNTKPGSDEEKAITEELVKVMDRSIEMKKVEDDAEDKTACREINKRDQLFKNCITIGTALIGVGVTVWGSLNAWKFEEEGTVRSQAGREFVKRAVNFFGKK